ncbi:hypothetical protein [Actinoplanes couchii]|uniref:Lipoprotein n=1 Tax=Actinoplanes couchii TaxID=403638 RepID=A0ABQ3XEM1_9ACTN|nr:hypothetical protein [Actinoplanes couchii]MDR6319798.1 hypothetical protein [Actinoplanes couchii]GID56933.1 hypothetical protein Aco03nite_053370 [Actinoplanes couchii]
MVRRTLVVTALLTALAGCGTTGSTGADQAPPVASISQPPSAAAAAPGSSEGPRARLDTTQKELEEWALAYWQCMKDQGANVSDSPKSKINGVVDKSQATPEMFAACASKKPAFLPREMDPDLNPEYQRQHHEYVKCQQDKGMPIVETEGGWNYESSNVIVPPDADEIDMACRVEAFSGN